MKWLKRLLIGFLLLLTLLAAVPYFIPLSAYLPLIENTLSEYLRQPVRIRALKAAGLPLPHLTLEDVSVGKEPYLKIAAIKVTPELHTLLREVREIKQIELSGVVAEAGVLAQLPIWMADDGTRLRVKRVQVRNASIKLKQLAVTPLNADLRLKPDNTLEQAQINSVDGKLSVQAKPDKKDYLLEFSAKNWAPPLQPKLQFDALNFRGRVNADEIYFNQIHAYLFGGAVSGKAHLSWRKQWRLSGELSSKQVEISELVAMLSPQTSLSGKMTSEIKFAASAKTPQRLLGNPVADMDFHVQNGVLRNIDIAKAAKSVDKKAVQGGETRFEHFSGQLHLAEQTYQLSELDLESGLLKAGGAIDIAPDQKLSGMIQVQLKGSANLVGMPLTVGGTLQDPTLRPTTGTMAGAAFGTLLLGPGMGTSLGMRAGQWLEKLFGKKGAPPPPAKKSK